MSDKRPWSKIEQQTRDELERLHAAPPGSSFDDDTARNALYGLYKLQGFATKHREGSFFGHVKNLFEGLDPDGRLEAWKRAVIEAKGAAAGLSFIAGVAQSFGVTIPGAVLPPPPGPGGFRREREPAGRGFDHIGETDATLLDLQEQILASPDDDAPYLVYADRLQDLGRPQGELISIAIRGSRAAHDAYLEEHGEALLGPLTEATEGITLTWRRGFVDSARFVDDDGYIEELTALLTRPVGELLRELRLGMNDHPPSWDAELGLLKSTGPHVALRSVFIGDFEYPDETEMSWAETGNVQDIWAACPNLEELTVQGAEIELGEIAAPHLRRLSLRTGGLSAEPVESIANAELPRLEELELWLGDEGYGASVDMDTLAPILAGDNLPALKILRIMNAEITDEVVEALAESPLLKRLKEVDLSMGTMTSEGAAVITGNIGAFSHLTRLNVEDNAIGSDAADALAEHAFIHIGAQKNEDERYVSVGE